MEIEVAQLRTKCEMYERMLDMYTQEIERLQQLLLNNTKQSVSLKRVTNPGQLLFPTLQKNLEELSNEDITKHLTCSFPASQSLLQLLSKIFNGCHTHTKLCNVVNHNCIEYLAENNNLRKENYTFLFDKIFKQIFEKCKCAAPYIHENINCEQQNILSDNFHDNIMILTSDVNQKKKLQKEFLMIIKNDAFGN